MGDNFCYIPQEFYKYIDLKCDESGTIDINGLLADGISEGMLKQKCDLKINEVTTIEKITGLKLYETNERKLLTIKKTPNDGPEKTFIIIFVDSATLKKINDLVQKSPPIAPDVVDSSASILLAIKIYGDSYKPLIAEYENFLKKYKTDVGRLVGGSKFMTGGMDGRRPAGNGPPATGLDGPGDDDVVDGDVDSGGDVDVDDVVDAQTTDSRPAAAAQTTDSSLQSPKVDDTFPAASRPAAPAAASDVPAVSPAAAQTTDSSLQSPKVDDTFPAATRTTRTTTTTTSGSTGGVGDNTSPGAGAAVPDAKRTLGIISQLKIENQLKKLLLLMLSNVNILNNDVKNFSTIADIDIHEINDNITDINNEIVELEKAENAISCCFSRGGGGNQTIKRKSQRYEGGRRSPKKRRSKCSRKRKASTCRKAKRCSYVKRSKRSRGHCKRSPKRRSKRRSNRRRSSKRR